ncbi:MAG: hypothetical protein GYB41_04315 [Oceanospirillales bacterium]|nr:hypothetical protein [Oceanospirillales bacterium]
MKKGCLRDASQSLARDSLSAKKTIRGWLLRRVPAIRSVRKTHQLRSPSCFKVS